MKRRALCRAAGRTGYRAALCLLSAAASACVAVVDADRLDEVLAHERARTDRLEQQVAALEAAVEATHLHTHLLIIRSAAWYDAEQRPAGVPELDNLEPKAGHLLLRIAQEATNNQHAEHFARFYQHVDKEFVLRAPGRPDLQAVAERGLWRSVLYLRIPATYFASMAAGVPYQIIPRNSSPTHHWLVETGVSIRRSAAAQPRTSEPRGSPRATEEQPLPRF